MNMMHIYLKQKLQSIVKSFITVTCVLLFSFPLHCIADDGGYEGLVYSAYILDIQDTVNIGGKELYIFETLKHLPQMSKRVFGKDCVFSDEMDVYVSLESRGSDDNVFAFVSDTGINRIHDQGVAPLVLSDRVLFFGWETGTRIVSSSGEMIKDFQANIQSARYLRSSSTILIQWSETWTYSIVDLDGEILLSFPEPSPSHITISNDGKYLLFRDRPLVEKLGYLPGGTKGGDSDSIRKESNDKSAHETPHNGSNALYVYDVVRDFMTTFTFSQDSHKLPDNCFISSLFGEPILIYSDFEGERTRLLFAKPSGKKGVIPFEPVAGGLYYFAANITENFDEKRLVITLQGKTYDPLTTTCIFIEIDRQFNVVNRKGIIFPSVRGSSGLVAVVSGDYLVTKDYSGTVRILEW